MQGKETSGKNACAELLKVLADETRLRVLRVLMDGPKRVADINQVVRVEQSLLSHHLKVLREKGFVVAERQGKSVCYRLASEMVAESTLPTIDLGCCLLTFE